MRSGRSIEFSGLALLLALASSCSGDDRPDAVLGPEPAGAALEPGPIVVSPREPRPAQSADPPRRFEPVPVGAGRDDVIDGGVPSTIRRLVFQCSDDVTFAVRMSGDRLEVFPPGYTLGYIVLTRQQIEPALVYTRRNAEFRSSGDLATLVLGDERYVDCVANPAAAAWESPPRPSPPQR